MSDAKSGAEIFALKGHMKEISSAAFSPDGAQIVTGSGEVMVRLERGERGRNSLSFWATPLLSVRRRFSADGSMVVTGSGDNTARVWNSKSGAELHSSKGVRALYPRRRSARTGRGR